FWLVLWFLPLAAHAQDVFTLTADRLQNGQAVELDKLGWKYSPNDDPRFADPQFDDRAWETLNGTAITLDGISKSGWPKSGWRGIGWFRLRLQIDPALANQPLALAMAHFGASEIYLDGRLVQSFGTIGATPKTEVGYNPNTLPFGIVLDGFSEHVIAVRYSCLVMRDSTSWWSRWLHQLDSRQFLKTDSNETNGFGAGFGIWIQELKQAQVKDEMRRSLDGVGFDLYTSGVTLAIGLLHLLLFWFYPSQRANLFFGVSACFTSVAGATTYLLSTGHYGARETLFLHLVTILSGYSSLVSILAFLYTVFLLRLPNHFRLWPIAAVSFFLTSSLNLRQWGFLIFFALVLVETLRVVIQAIRNRADGAWILGIGLLFCGTALLISGLYTLSGINPPLTLRIIATLSLVLSPSIFLARRFARTNLHLETQLVQVKKLSAEALEHEKVKAENARRAKELEEARELQLSMLPKKLPNLPHLDISAYMKTASEVGGDYYDFHLGEDGTLTIAVGDATGHGLKAGTMVTATKSLFDTLAHHSDITNIFNRLSRTLKRMNLRGLFMAMMIVKLKDNQLSASIAGMPPVLIFRAASGEVEEIAIRGIPLGGLSNYQYQQREVALACDDVVLLMSDGLPERFNARQEMLDYAPIKQTFAEVHSLPSQEIIQQLVNLGERWADGQSQDDDITFVVVKIVESKQ
ncbi:MAG: SpoIIE family protein phosphatase, partial [Blastocatellia bacterium]